MKLRFASVFLLLSASVFAADQVPSPKAEAAPKDSKSTVPSYPIATDVFTTLDKTVLPTALPANAPALLPCQVSEYAKNGYGQWSVGAGTPYVKTDMQTNATTPSVPDQAAAKLLTFFTMSDIHIVDKESPAQVPFFGYQGGVLSNSSAYSAVALYTTHVLDAAIQTVNALNQKQPFDCGIFLGDAVNNNQYNELRWYIDVIDGKRITPSSGAHRGAKTIDYQKPYQAAGLDKSINWYQVMGNHDQLWVGCLRPDDYIKKTLVGPKILNLGNTITPNNVGILATRGYYMGVVDGTTKYGDIIDVGAVDYYSKPPRIRADHKRRSLSVADWMGEFLKTTSQPAGHGFTKDLVKEGFACYHFYPKANVPIKVIALDDTDKSGSAAASLDYKRYNWLVKELDDGEAAGELMIICAHIPVHSYAAPTVPPAASPYMTTVASYSDISEATLLAKLHTYKNLVLWLSGHVHRNAITPQPASDGNPEYGFWEVETPSLRDFPQSFRCLEIVRNSDNNISIFAKDVDPAVNSAPLADGSASPALISRSYAVATQELFKNQIQQGPNVDPNTGVYNAELVKQLSPDMQAKLAQITPVVRSVKIDGGAGEVVTLNNTVAGSTPAYYMASESPSFGDASWAPYSAHPAFVMSAAARSVYFKVKDGSGAESPVARAAR